MTVYNYDLDGFLLDPTEARLDPEENLPVLPAKATFDIPLPFIPGETWNQWDGQKWNLVPDLRGVYYNIQTPEKNPIVQNSFANIPDLNEWTKVPPDETVPRKFQVFADGAWRYDLSLHVAFENKKKDIELFKLYFAKSRAAFTWTDGRTYQVSDDLNAGVNASNTGAGGDEIVEWDDINNDTQIFAIEDFRAMGYAIFKRGQALYRIMKAKKKELDLLEDVASIQSYDVNSGW